MGMKSYNILEEAEFLLFAQKVNDKYPFGDGHNDILMKRGMPSDLDSDDALNCYEDTNVTSVNETLLLNNTFVFADVHPQRYVIEAFLAAAQIGIAKGTGNSYCTKVIFNVGLMSSVGDFTSKATTTATPNVSTDSTDYQLLSAGAFFPEDSIFEIPNKDSKFALQTKVYGKVVSGSGKIKLMCSRGVKNTYVEFFVRGVLWNPKA